ncbi:MAG TPA: M28 family peptidase [Terriglobia bacterium]|nr:M28 family peptidase [Terriglobia bacterium]
MKAVPLPILCVFIAGLLILAQPAQVPTSALIDSSRLLEDLKVLSADGMQGRRTGTAGGLKARSYIVERFKASGIAPFGISYEQSFTFRGRTGDERGANVIGRIDGTQQPRRYIVISAHYDHLGTVNGVVFNGADDNASGTAALFAIARYFAGKSPRNSLIFAAFDAEELGHHGSLAFVKQPPVPVQSISLNLNLDMIGREPDRRLFVVGTRFQPFLRPAVETAAATSPVRLIFGHDDPSRPEDWTEDSDHFSFIRAKIPALYFGVEDFDQHHKATDDYETMTHEFYVRAVETLVKVVEQFDANLHTIDRARTLSR